MVSVFLTSLLALPLLLVVDGTSLQGDLPKTLDKHSAKRSNGLLADVVNLLVAEQREREKLLEENKVMKKSTEEIKKRLDAEKTVTKETSGQIKHLQGQLDITKQSVTAHIEKSSKQFETLKNQSGSGSIGNRRLVGFSVRFRSNRDESGVLKYDYIVANYGNRYDRTTGKFTCNTTGLYIFNLYIYYSTKGAYASLMKNVSDIAVALSSFDDDNNAWDGSGVGIAVKLDVGDEVWVVGTSAYYHGWSSFSGALI